jgi:MFS family permease
MAGRRTTVGSSLATALSAVPPFLVGALTPAIRQDIDLDTRRLGILVAAYFLAGALAAVPGAKLAERLGPRQGLIVTGTVTSLSLVAIALLADSWIQLGGFLVIAGIANGMVHPAGNLAIVSGVAVARRGLAFGLKQAAAPLATMFAGMALPLLAFTLGWRKTFLLATFLLPLIVFVLPRGLAAPPSRGGRGKRLADPLLIATAVASALAFGGATTVGAFLVDSVTSNGGRPAVAGAVLTVASLACIAVRIAIGWQTDRMKGPSIGLVATLMAVGGAGLFVLGLSPPWWWPLAAVVGLAAGWGWPGLLYHSVAATYPESPAGATAVATTGNALGAAAGPFIFGFVASRFSFSVAWISSGTALLIAAILMAFIGRRRRLPAAG